MMRKLLSTVCVATFVLGGSAMLAGQSKNKPAGPAAYDHANETTVGGTITQVISAVGPDGAVGVHATVKTEAGLVNVQIGPAMYIGMNNFSFLLGDRVAIIGAKVTQNGVTAVWTRAITKDGQTLVLRDENGTPKWTVPLTIRTAATLAQIIR